MMYPQLFMKNKLSKDTKKRMTELDSKLAGNP